MLQAVAHVSGPACLAFELASRMRFVFAVGVVVSEMNCFFIIAHLGCESNVMECCGEGDLMSWPSPCIAVALERIALCESFRGWGSVSMLFCLCVY